MSEQETQVQAGHKVVFKSGKVVFLREPMISDMEAATQISGKGNTDNVALLGVMTQKEMLKLLIVSIDGKKPSAMEIQQLNKLFSLKEYNQLTSVVRKLTEPDEEGNAENEIAFEVTSDK